MTLPRWLTTLAWLSVACAVLVLFGLWPLAGGDLLSHLTVGRWIWAQGAVPRLDVFSYDSPGEFIAPSWASEVVFFLIARTAGPGDPVDSIGLMLLRLILTGLALFAAVGIARLLNAPWSALILLTPITLCLLWGRVDIRPQLFSSLFLVIELWVLISVHTGRRSWRWLWGLPPMCALWINLHGGWPQGVAMLMAIMGALVLRHIRGRVLGSGTPSHLHLQHLGPVLVACGLALWINPYGTRLLYFPLEMQAPWIRAMTLEWQTPFLNPLWSQGGVGVYVNIAPVFYGYLALLVGVWLSTVRHWRTADVVPAAVMSLWLVACLWHLRAVGDAVLLTSPLVAASLRSAWWHTRQWPAVAGIGLTCSLAATALWLTGAPPTVWAQQSRPALACVAATIERLGLSGNVYSPGTLSEWLLYRFHPRLRGHILWEFVSGQERNAAAARTLATDYFARHQVDVAVLPNGLASKAGALEGRGYHFVHVDDVFSILVRAPDRRTMPTFRVIRPWLDAPVTLRHATQVLTEVERARQYCPDASTFTWAYQARALQAMGRHDEATDASQHIPARPVIQ